jgi:copper chaperone
MNQETIIVANLKCEGCATTIQNRILGLNGVKSVDVDLVSDSVKVNSEGIGRDVIVQLLSSLGYPEATDKNGLLLKLKSYGSCLIGRVSRIRVE